MRSQKNLITSFKHYLPLCTSKVSEQLPPAQPFSWFQPSPSLQLPIITIYWPDLIRSCFTTFCCNPISFNTNKTQSEAKLNKLLNIRLTEQRTNIPCIYHIPFFQDGICFTEGQTTCVYLPSYEDIELKSVNKYIQNK